MPPPPSILLSTAYLPPIQYMAKFLSGFPVLIEKHENYQKQSYRNRCYIYGANGRQCLVIPVKKLHGEKTPIREVEIDYTSNWQKIHLKSIESAYRLSAFYDYYEDDLIRMYESRTPLLFDWNLGLIRLIMEWLCIPVEPAVTFGYQKVCDPDIDFRQSISPKERLKRPDAAFESVPYQQVFQDRHGFMPNLSIVDLLFNEGPAALESLKRTIRSKSRE